MAYIRYLVLALLLALLAACGQVMQPEGRVGEGEVIVVTEGVPAPAAVTATPTVNPLSTLDNATVSVGGSSTTPLSVNGEGCTEFPARQVVITYTVSGNQANNASFDVYTKWDFDGMAFVGSNATTVNVLAATGAPRTYQVTISVENASGLGSGHTSFVVAPFNLVTNPSDPPGQRLSFGASSSATIYVAFDDCAPDVVNTPPSLTIPADLTVEATSSAGASVTFSVPATDVEDGDLTDDVVCTPASGSTFPIGETEVACSVVDSGGLSAEGSFKIYVQDTTPPVFTSFPGDTTLIATGIAGVALDLAAFTITAEDKGPAGEPGDVSGPVSIACTIGGDPADGYQIAIGQTVTVSCTATDSASYRAPDSEAIPAPNTSDAQTFEVFVSLDLGTTCGFGAPLRNAAPYSAHKRNSTIPHKLCPPAYADGSLATDLAGGLRLVLTPINGSSASDAIEANDYSAGSTTWRYDPDAGHYIFNLKTERTWAEGQYETSVSYAGIELAKTYFQLQR